MPEAKQQRDVSLDFLRGSAVIFMILTHVIVLFYNGNSSILDFWGWWGGTVCFTIFLFVFSSIFGLKLAKERLNLIRELFRSVKFLFGYYVVVLWVYFFRSPYLRFESWDDVLKMLALINLQEYTEFILAFIWYVILLVMFKPIWGWLAKNYSVLIPLAILIYFIGHDLNQMVWGSGYINIIKSQLVGHADYHTFGIVSYFPILAAGLVWGYQIGLGNTRLPMYAPGLAVVFGVAYYLLGNTGLSSMDRWPPQAQFLLYGLTYCFAIIALFGLIKKIKPLLHLGLFVGKHPFEYYVYHLVILLPWFRFGGEVQADDIRTWMVFLITMIGTGLFITFHQYVGSRQTIEVKGIDMS